ncbi:hypothetical protein [Diaphorobacter sp. HDW4A]|nr:hypothetical protein [Diaphorobacter sp. HDW4A]
MTRRAGVRDIAAKNGMAANIDEALAGIKLQHVDQTNESDCIS